MSELKDKPSIYWWIMNKYGITKGSTYKEPTMSVSKCAGLISEKLSDAQAEIDEKENERKEETKKCFRLSEKIIDLKAKNKELEELVNYYKSLLTSDKEIKERFKTLKK